ncbi:MAG TPA: pyrroline-5-carboxylate reductase [Cryomorphaceae bacterium]|nr:pyrroline-5-carboxylate reductase [Cryomorphaceae bacterium]
METSKITTAIIGCGNLGKALALGFLDGGIPADNIHVTTRGATGLDAIASRGISIGTDNVASIADAQLVIVAVKPYNMDAVLKELAPHLDPDRHVLVSVVTGITLAHISSFLKPEVSVFRAMPNTAADVKESLTCIAQGHTRSLHTDLVHAAFKLVGPVIPIAEELMEAATVMGACGIAYVMRFIRAMVQGGIQIGFDAKTAGLIVQQTVKGAAELLITNESHPESEIDKVTTPKGCTIAGLNEMEHNGFSSALIKGIVASHEKIVTR